VSAQIMLSRLQLANRNAALAVQMAKQAQEQLPGDLDSGVALVRALIAQNSLDLASAQARTLVTRYPQVPGVHSITGVLLMARNDLPAARTAFTRALEGDPDYVEALSGLMVLDLRAGNPTAAVARIERRTLANPKNAELHYVAARTYAAAGAGNQQKAESALRRVIELSPDHLDAYLMLGRMYASQKRLDEAVKEFDAAAARHPDEVSAPTMAAMIVHMQNRLPEAQKRYEAIVAGNPRRAPIAANNLAWMIAEQGGNLDVALQLAQAAKVQMPDSVPINDTLGWIYYKKDLATQAIPLFQASVSGDPTNPTLHLHLGLAYAKAGQNDRAQASLDRALKINPQFEGASAARQALATLGTKGTN
jgi:tetratricopeptide (TPR) repeat protein